MVISTECRVLFVVATTLLDLQATWPNSVRVASIVRAACRPRTLLR